MFKQTVVFFVFCLEIETHCSRNPLQIHTGFFFFFFWKCRCIQFDKTIYSICSSLYTAKMSCTRFTHTYKAHTITVWIRLDAVAPFPSHMQQVYDALAMYFSHNHTKTMTLSAALIQAHSSQTHTLLLCHSSMAVSRHCYCPPSHLTSPNVTQCGVFYFFFTKHLPAFLTALSSPVQHQHHKYKTNLKKMI